MRIILWISFLLISVLWACKPSIDYDVIIRDGTVIDGSGAPRFEADVAINSDTIAFIGDLSGKTASHEVDASRLVVSPGFINMLSWANVALLEDGRSQGDIRQGVTLEVMGEGDSMGPLSEDMKAEMKEDQVDIKYDVNWTTLGEYLQYLEDKGVSPNVASFVGNGTVRQHVIGYENRKATSEELDQMKNLVRTAMEEGAVGMSTSLLYAPSGYADTEEIIELSKVVSEYNGMYTSHIRDEGDSLIGAVNELITIAREADLASEIYHLKASGKQNWHKLDSVIQMVEAAQKEGLAITADIYTYPASSTGLHVQLPDWVREGGVESTIQRLADSSLRPKILSEIRWNNPPESILLVGFKNEALRKYIGKYLPEVAEERGVTPEEAMIDLIVEDDSRIQVVYFSMSEENIARKVAIPWVSFCSDAGSYTNEGVFIKQSTHPRAYGSFIRVLGKYARDEGVITLEEGVRKLSSLPAKNLRIEKRGLLAVGNYADVVVFDPERVDDNATFEQPHQYAVGIIHVFVNGEQVIKDGDHTGAMPGRFVKGPGWKE